MKIFAAVMTGLKTLTVLSIIGLLCFGIYNTKSVDLVFKITTQDDVKMGTIKVVNDDQKYSFGYAKELDYDWIVQAEKARYKKEVVASKDSMISKLTQAKDYTVAKIKDIF